MKNLIPISVHKDQSHNFVFDKKFVMYDKKKLDGVDPIDNKPLCTFFKDFFFLI